MKNNLWVVEINFSEPKKWQPTVGVGLSREDARKVLAEWKAKNVAQFRLRRYISARSQSK